MLAFIILAVAVGLLFGARTLAIHLAIKWGKLRDYRADDLANAYGDVPALPAISDPNLSHYGTAFNATGVTE